MGSAMPLQKETAMALEMPPLKHWVAAMPAETILEKVWVMPLVMAVARPLEKASAMSSETVPVLPQEMQSETAYSLMPATIEAMAQLPPSVMPAVDLPSARRPEQETVPGAARDPGTILEANLMSGLAANWRLGLASDRHRLVSMARYQWSSQANPDLMDLRTGLVALPAVCPLPVFCLAVWALPEASEDL